MVIKLLIGINAVVLLITWSLHALYENEWKFNRELYSCYLITASTVIVYLEFAALMILAVWGLCC